MQLQEKVTYLGMDGPVSPWILQKQRDEADLGAFGSMSWAVVSPGPLSLRTQQVLAEQLNPAVVLFFP